MEEPQSRSPAEMQRGKPGTALLRPRFRAPAASWVRTLKFRTPERQIAPGAVDSNPGIKTPKLLAPETKGISL